MIHILTHRRHCMHEQVKYVGATPAVEGEFIKLTDVYNEFDKVGVAETPDIGACPVAIDTERPDTGGTPMPFNPEHVFVGSVDKVSVLRNWADKMIVTDQIEPVGLAFGDQLTIVGGKFVKMTLATQHLFGFYRGADPHGFVHEGHVIHLVPQARFAVA